MRKSKELRKMTSALVLYSRLNISKGCANSLEIYERIVGVCGNRRELALDLLAVRDLLMILKLKNDVQMLNIINEIYFLPFAKHPQRQIGKSEMSYRILRFAYENHMDERTVYRKLQKARSIWQKARCA